jgi:hypothetical protein
MISIIICSRTKKIDNKLYDNIKDTIGCIYELIVIDNSKNRYSIFEAYNLGIEKSVNEYLCFVHDDILIHTKDWGQVIKNIFKDDVRVGLVGIAGAKSKTKTPSLWWSSPSEHKFVYLMQHIPGKEPEKWITGFDVNSREEVVVIDGVFMALRKQTKLNFSEELKGFHNYDLNISFEVIMNKFKIIVTNEILIEHFSIGNINREWINSSYQVHKIYRNLLPLCVSENSNQEIKNSIWFINESYALSQFKIGLKSWLKLVAKKPFLKIHFTFVKIFLIEVTRIKIKEVKKIFNFQN